MFIYKLDNRKYTRLFLLQSLFAMGCLEIEQGVRIEIPGLNFWTDSLRLILNEKELSVNRYKLVD